MPPDHITTSRIYGPCQGSAGLDRHTTGDPAHCFGLDIYCARCCPHCTPAFVERTGPVAGMGGQQTGLFADKCLKLHGIGEKIEESGRCEVTSFATPLSSPTIRGGQDA
jgi:hypothetical protein